MATGKKPTKPATGKTTPRRSTRAKPSPRVTPAVPEHTEVKTITIPHRFQPRSYQRTFLRAMQSGFKHGILVQHRRSGKETACLNYTAGEMWRRVGTYIHMFPELNRGRKILWNGMNREGMRFIDHFPAELVKSRHEQEMRIELTNGSQWQIAGADKNTDAIVGANPIGIVYSEFSQMKPIVRTLMNPILDENGGWEVINGTPRGKNHFYDLYLMAIHNPTWYASLLTIDDTRRDAPGEDGSPVITTEMVEARRREGIREPLIQQEYYVSFEAGVALQFVPGEYITAAFVRPRIPWAYLPKIIGCDVGRNRDRTSMMVRQGGALLEQHVIYPYQTTDNPTEYICGTLARLCQAHQPSAVFIDGVGIGVAVVDGMRRLGFTVVSVLGNSKSPNPAYFNLRAYMWGEMREWLRTIGQLERGRDDVLAAELQWPQMRWKGDREWLTPKDELEEVATAGEAEDSEEYHSPDVADSLSLTFAAPVTLRASTQGRRPRSAVVEYDPINLERAMAGYR